MRLQESGEMYLETIHILSQANPVVRSIIDADNKVDPAAETVRFDVKPHKIFLFNKETEERIYFEVK